MLALLLLVFGIYYAKVWLDKQPDASSSNSVGEEGNSVKGDEVDEEKVSSFLSSSRRWR
jgi:hypothetical protein